LGRRRTRGRDLSGTFLLDKPTGITSNHALQRVRRLFDANKAGHTGSLDPLATGVLPICLGEATKFSRYLLESDKSYRSTFTLGVETDTGDCDGQVTGSADASALTIDLISAAIDTFKGPIEQVPSMYSALKYQGQPLYKLARQGIEIERSARPVEIFDYRIERFTAGQAALLEVYVHCSKGTYVRSLAEDLGAVLGCGAHVSRLHRSSAGAFNESQSTSFEALQTYYDEGGPTSLDRFLLPVDAAIADRPAAVLDDRAASLLLRGQAVLSPEGFIPDLEADIVRVFRDDETFLGVAKLTDDGYLAPSRLVVA
jgi:tRNA pseudouridine55 synthase